MKRSVLLGALALVGAANIWAAQILSPVSDQLTIYNANAAIVGQVILLEDGTFSGLNAACFGPTCGTAEDSANVYYIDLSLALNLTPPPTMVLESANVGSDVFGVINIDGVGFSLHFRSDSEASQFTPTAGYTLLPEGNGIFDATSYLNPDLVLSGYTAQFTSDPSEIPEPATAVLLGAGMLAIAGWRQRRH